MAISTFETFSDAIIAATNTSVDETVAAACKLSPTVDVFSVTITPVGDAVEVIVYASIGDYDISGEVLEGYADAVCILSADTSLSIPISATLSSKYHWTDPLWYSTYTGEGIIMGKRTNSSATDIQFEFVIDSTIQNLSFFTYIQVDTQSMEDEYSIDIPLTSKNMSGDYTSDIILTNGEIPESEQGFIIDYRRDVNDDKI